MNSSELMARLEAWSRPAPASATVHEVQAACPHDCPDTCAMRVSVDNGKVIAVKGDPTHSLTDGTLCTKVSRYAERTYHPDRLTAPLKRIGKKGEGRFVAIGWDEAMSTIADRLATTWRRNPEGILNYSYAGTMGKVQGEGMAQRLWYALGSSQLLSTICAEAGSVGLRRCMGAGVGMDPEAIIDSRLIILWATNPVTSHVHLWAKIQEAKRAGAILWSIDPYRSEAAAKSHHHLALRPGTDAALAYTIAHVLQRDGHLDLDYLRQHTTGSEDYLRRADEWSPQRAADYCAVPVEQIEALAQAYATTRPAAIRLNYGVQRNAGGSDAVRAIMALPALAGHWRHPSGAGGAVLSASGWVPKNSHHERPDLLGARNPRAINMSAIGDALTQADPPIEALVVYNSNPLAVAPDSNAVRQGFAREDLFTVVIEHFQTDTADYADIVLPATTQLEHFDIHSAYGHLHLLLNRPAIAPLAEARPNSRIFRELAAQLRARLGDACPALHDPALRASDVEIAAEAFNWQHPALAGAPAEALLANGHARLNAGHGAPFAQGGFPTADGRYHFADPDVPQVTPNREGPDSALAKRYPLQLISPPPRHLLNSSFANVGSLRALAGDSHEPTVLIHPDDAAARKLSPGGTARLFNDRGSTLAKTVISDRARPGVAVAFSIFWHKHTPGGNNGNALTSQALTVHGEGATFYDCLVEVAPADSHAPTT